MKSQSDQIIIFYHDQEPNRPSQIKLLCDEAESYRDMSYSIQSAVTRKYQDLSSASIFTLKITLALDLNANHRCGQHVVVLDLEIKIANDSLLVTGRSLHAISKNGFNFYRKALSYSDKNCDLNKNEPTESRMSAADVIDFAWRKAHKDVNDVEGDDSAEEE